MTDQTQPPQAPPPQGPPPQPQQYAAYQQPVPPQQPQFQNGAGVAALVLGIVAVLLCWIPIVGYVSVVLGIIGIVLAIVGFVNVRKGSANNSAVVVIGGVLSAVAIVVPWIVFAIVMNVVDKGIDRVTEYSDCIAKAETPEELEACEPK